MINFRCTRVLLNPYQSALTVAYTNNKYTPILWKEFWNALKKTIYIFLVESLNY